METKCWCGDGRMDRRAKRRPCGPIVLMSASLYRIFGVKGTGIKQIHHHLYYHVNFSGWRNDSAPAFRNSRLHGLDTINTCLPTSIPPRKKSMCDSCSKNSLRLASWATFARVEDGLKGDIITMLRRLISLDNNRSIFCILPRCASVYPSVRLPPRLCTCLSLTRSHPDVSSTHVGKGHALVSARTQRVSRVHPSRPLLRGRFSYRSRRGNHVSSHGSRGGHHPL